MFKYVNNDCNYFCICSNTDASLDDDYVIPSDSHASALYSRIDRLLEGTDGDKLEAHEELTASKHEVC